MKNIVELLSIIFLSLFLASGIIMCVRIFFNKYNKPKGAGTIRNKCSNPY